MCMDINKVCSMYLCKYNWHDKNASAVKNECHVVAYVKEDAAKLAPLLDLKDDD